VFGPVAVVAVLSKGAPTSIPLALRIETDLLLMGLGVFIRSQNDML
jgi:hypothetical protein